MPSLRDDVARPASTVAFARIAALIGSIVAVSVLRYATAPSPNVWHELSLRLYYVPILAGAYWYGPVGGVLVASISSIMYVHRVLPSTPVFDGVRYAEVVVFYLIGLSVGVLASAQRRVLVRFQQAAVRLESANQQLRESTAQIRRMDRLKTLGEVATGLAHEIRHPLASIGGALEIIEARSKTNTPEAEFSRLAMAEVQRLDKLVWEFLRYARPHAPDLQSLPLHEVVAQAATLLGVEAERAQVRLDVEKQREPLLVSMDPLQMEQVVLNVLLNAIQATLPGGRVVVRTGLADGLAFVDVIDEGPGVPPEHLSRIFSPFFTTREKGTGLGLAIAQHIVAAHAGRLEVAYTTDSGTCFRLYLPLGEALASLQSSTSSEVAS